MKWVLSPTSPWFVPTSRANSSNLDLDSSIPIVNRKRHTMHSQPPTHLISASDRSTGDPRPVDAPAAGGFAPAQVLHALRRRWLIAIPIALAMAAIVSVGAESQLTPIYSARTLLHVSADRPILLYDILGGRTDTANHQRMQIATVKSKLIRESVVRELAPRNLATLQSRADPVRWLEKEIVADYSVAPEILRVTMKGSEPDDLLVILNSIRDIYLREVINNDRMDRVARLTNLMELAAKHDGLLKSERKKLANRVEALGARDFPTLRGKYEFLIGRIPAVQNELLLARVETPRAEVSLPENPAPKEDPTPDASAIESSYVQAFASDPIADGLRKEVARLEKKLADFERLRAYQSDPEYKRAAAELAATQTTLARRREAIRESAVNYLLSASRLPKPMPAVAPERVPLPSVRQSASVLEAELQRLEQEAGELAKGIAELELVRSEIAKQEEHLGVVNSKIRTIEVELQAPSRAGVIEDANIFETPKPDRWLKLVAVPAVATFFAVLFIALWLDVRRGRVNGVADLEAASIRVIGAVPLVRSNVLPMFTDPPLGSSRRQSLQLADAIDMTRAVIAPALTSTAGFAIVVTSAVAGEGKTIVSAHLASRLARSGLRTLLIDTDTRRPKIAQLFGLKGGPGFYEWLGGIATLSDVAARGPVAGLDIISAGGGPTRTAADPFEHQFPELLRAAKEKYDVVVLDTAPLLSTPETLALSRLADGVVLSAMRDVSRVADVQACTERLASIDARVLGAVVTGDASARSGS